MAKGCQKPNPLISRAGNALVEDPMGQIESVELTSGSLRSGSIPVLVCMQPFDFHMSSAVVSLAH